jgi:hypothetical protein
MPGRGGLDVRTRAACSVAAFSVGKRGNERLKSECDAAMDHFSAFAPTPASTGRTKSDEQRKRLVSKQNIPVRDTDIYLGVVASGVVHSRRRTFVRFLPTTLSCIFVSC